MVTLLTDPSCSAVVLERDWPPFLKGLVASIQAHQNIQGDVIVRENEKAFLVQCQINYDRPSEIKRALETNEPIAVSVSKDLPHSFNAPSIFSDRVDFPRNLPHLNPVKAESPVNFCLSEHGNQGLFDHRGIAAILDATAYWLHDAAADSLNHAGWEPHPTNAVVPGQFDAAWYQQLAYKVEPDRSVTLTGQGAVIRLKETSSPLKVELISEDVAIPKADWDDLEDTDALSMDRVPWVLISAPRNNVTTDYFSTEVQSWEELAGHCTQAQCGNELQEFIESVLEYEPKAIRSGLVVLLGIWRPMRLIDRIPGLADGEARRLELVPYLVTWLGDKPATSSAKVERIRHFAANSQKLLRAIGKTEPSDVRIAIVGCGALGSKIATHLGREGVESLMLVDNESFEPHNFARHALFMDSLLENKAMEVANKLNSVVDSDEIEHYWANIDVIKTDEAELGKLCGQPQSLVIDATANRQVHRKLVGLNCEESNCRMMRVTINDGGRMGLALLEGASRNPRCDDVLASVYFSAVNDDDVFEWLQRADSEDRDGLLLGLGCSSLTTKLADHIVSAHASSMTGLVHRVREHWDCRPGFGILIVDDYGVPKETKWSGVPQFRELQSNIDTGWSLRVSEKVLEDIRNRRVERLPDETGGYLYGLWDDVSCTVTIVFSTASAPEHASSTGLRLPAAANTDEERLVLRRTQGMILPVGTWHSHPGESAEPSHTDIATFEQFRADNEATPRPVVVLIVAETETKALVGL